MPRAWGVLLAEQDSVLLDLLAEKVEDLCGYRPDLDTCSRYLATVTPSVVGARFATAGTQPRSSARGTGSTTPAKTPPAMLAVQSAPGFTMGGQRHRASSAREVLHGILTGFAQQDSTFLDRLAARKHGRKRRYIARQRTELYPDRPDLAADHAVELVSGWWMGTNYSKRSILEIIELACEIAGVSTQELQVQLG